MQLPDEKILEISKLTIGQAKSESWLISRKHRLTESNFGVTLEACKRNRFPKSKRLTGTKTMDI